MVIEDDLQADLAGVVDDLVHDLQAVRPCRSGFLAKSMPLGAAVECSMSLENGRRMVLKPSCFIWSIMSL